LLEDFGKNAPVVKPNCWSGMLLQSLEFLQLLFIAFALEYTLEESSDGKAVHELIGGLLFDFHHPVLISLAVLDEGEALQPLEGLGRNL
jgi:hypothetical protein